MVKVQGLAHTHQQKDRKRYKNDSCQITSFAPKLRLLCQAVARSLVVGSLLSVGHNTMDTCLHETANFENMLICNLGGDF